MRRRTSFSHELKRRILDLSSCHYETYYDPVTGEPVGYDMGGEYIDQDFVDTVLDGDPEAYWNID